MLFFYGEDEYQIAQATKTVAGNFIKEQKTDLNIFSFDSDSLTAEKLNDSLLSVPFLGDKKLTIIKNFILDNTDEKIEKRILSILPELPEYSDVVFSEIGKASVKNKLYKYLEKNAEKTYFGPVNPVVARQFVQKILERSKIKIENPAVAKLCFSVGSDLWRLRNETKKVIDYVQSQDRDEIKVADIDEMVEAGLSLKIFDLTDALADRNSKRTLKIFSDFLAADEDVAMILSMVIYQIRNMLIVSDLLQSNQRGDLAKMSGLHPFVLQKTERAVRKTNYQRLVWFYHELAEIDWQIKTGQKEVVTSLTMLFVDFCENDKL